MSESRLLHLVVPTLDRAGCEGLLRRLLEGERRLSRLTVVAQGSTTAPGSELAVVAGQHGVTFEEMFLPSPVGAARARYIGATAGTEEYVGFIDDDIAFESGTVSDLVDLCVREHLGGASARITDDDPIGATRLAARSILFRGIFSDPRARLYREGATAALTPLLPTGAVVYVRAEYDRCSSLWTEYDAGYTLGEDAELSFCVSQRRLLAVAGHVVAHNRRRRQGAPTGGAARAHARLVRYRAFSSAHSRSPRDELHYSLVLVALFAAVVRERAGLRAAMEVLAELRRAVSRTLRRDTGAMGGRLPADKTPGRDVDLVVRSLGRPHAVEVVRTAITRERRLRRVIVVWQSAEEVDVDDIRKLASTHGIAIDIVHSSKPLGLAGARLAGIERVRSAWTAFIDDDITFEHGSLDDLVECAEVRRGGGAGGFVRNYEENTTWYRLMKRLLFRGLFRDPRAEAAVRRKPFRSPVLSGGVAVFRTDLLKRNTFSLARFDGYGRGEDFEISFAVSRDAPLYIVPTVVVHNGARGLLARPSVEVGIGRVLRYRDFALAHARSRRDWAAYGLVTLSLVIKEAWPPTSNGVMRYAWGEVRRALRMALRRRDTSGARKGLPSA